MCGIIALFGKTKGKEEQLRIAASTLTHRGPDRFREYMDDKSWWGFHRLAIMDTSTAGDQPFFEKDGSILICNGEIYNHHPLRQILGREFTSGSDCEVLLPLLARFGIEVTCDLLDGEFAFVAFDAVKKCILAARDPLGIRPLFWGKTEDDSIVFASEVKGLQGLCDKVQPFPPGHYFDGTQLRPFRKTIVQVPSDLKESMAGIRSLLIRAVEKRLEADVPLGFLLSGGLDSSLVCGIAAKILKKPLKTFSIGMVDDAIDIKYAREVADYLKTDHHEVFITKEDVIAAIPKVIKATETWDITTIRASIGMYLVCEYVKKTGVKVLLTGEVSDELFGYKYTDFAPTAAAFQTEAEKRITELHYYDVLRADRCIAAHGLEARVPFSDKFFVQFVMEIDPELKLNRYGMGKYLLRTAFKEDHLIPEPILMRDKAAFSDAVGHSMVSILKEFAESKYSDLEFERISKSMSHVSPISKEALLYREIFESFYPGKAELIPAYWLPNQDWKHCKVSDPSARFLPNYGASGH